MDGLAGDAGGRRAANGRADLPQLAERPSSPTTTCCCWRRRWPCWGSRKLADGDLHLTELGRRYVAGAHTLRQQLAGQQLLAHVPLAAHIRHSLEQAPSGRIAAGAFPAICWKKAWTAPTAERVLRTAIEWGRYGEVFEFDLADRQIHLPAGEEQEKNAL